MVFRVSEIYPSVQGEGPHVGIPTTFVRFGGCNLRCPGWPCDTPHAIFADKYRQEWEKKSTEEVLVEIGQHPPRNICLTGGEPMLQPNVDIVNLVEALTDLQYNVEMFSNGTLAYPEQVVKYMDGIVLDWKLPGSGEYGVGNDVRKENMKLIAKRAYAHSIKFTIADKHDFDTAVHTWIDNIVPMAHKPEVFAGIVWDREMTNEHLVELILEHRLPWRLNVQVHNHVWDRSQRGI